MTRRREEELSKLRKDIEALNLAHEDSDAHLRRRNQQLIAELSGQIESLQKAKSRLEKDKSELLMEVDGLSTNLDSVTKIKVGILI